MRRIERDRLPVLVAALVAAMLAAATLAFGGLVGTAPAGAVAAGSATASTANQTPMQGQPGQAPQGQTPRGQTPVGQAPQGQAGAGQQSPVAPGQGGPPDILAVKILLLAELGAWEEPLPAPIQQIWQVVPLKQWVDVDSREDLLNALEHADDQGVAALTRIRSTGTAPSDAVAAALGPLSEEEWQHLDDDDEFLATPATTYEQALSDLFTSAGAAPATPQPFPQQKLDGILTNLNVGLILDREADTGGTGGTTPPSSGPPTTRPGQPVPPTVVTANTAASTESSSTTVVLLALLGVLALVVIALVAVLLSRRRDEAVVEKAERAEQADGLLDVASRLTRARDLAEVERMSVSEAVRIAGGSGGGFVAVEPGGLRVTHQSPDTLLVPDRIGEGVVSRVVDTGQPVATVSQTEPAVSQLPVALVAVPIISRGSVRAVLVVIRHGIGSFGETEVAALTKLAPVAAAALDTFDRLHSAEAESLVDPLTRLGNRRSLDQALGAVAGGAGTDGDHPVSVLMVDVDHFKHFNDTNGHEAGDVALRAVGAAIADALREGDTAYRFGGEEFCVILPGADEAQAAGVGERIRSAVSAVDIPGAADQPGGRLTVSVGVAEGLGTAAEAALGVADRALYAAKSTGRDRVVVASQVDGSSDG